MRSLTDNLRACRTSGDFSTADESRPCPEDEGDACEVPEPSMVTPVNRAAADAFARARDRGASKSEDRTAFAAKVRPPSSGSPVEFTKESPTPHALDARPGPSASSPAVDPLDAALDDFLGDDRRIRRDSEDIRLIYGEVFDPEKAAAQRSARTSQTSPKHRIVPADDSFGWDDEELDAPIDPEHVRRKIGSRTDGVPQFGIFRKRKKD